MALPTFDDREGAFEIEAHGHFQAARQGRVEDAIPALAGRWILP
jgi:hypothetical protein